MTVLTLRQIADKVGVTKRTALRWAQLPDWPPVAEVQVIRGRDTRLYNWHEVEDLLSDTRRWDAVAEVGTARRGRISQGICGNGLHDVTDDASVYVNKTSGVRRCAECHRIGERRRRQALRRREIDMRTEER